MQKKMTHLRFHVLQTYFCSKQWYYSVLIIALRDVIDHSTGTGHG